MADNEVSIILKAVDKVSAVMSGINKSIQKVNDSPLGKVAQQLTGFNLTSLGAAGAVTMLAKEVGKAVNETSVYNSQIKDTARLLGLTTEETSRLVQAADDLFVSEDTLKTAFQAASRQGIDVSIKGLKSLSEQYLALNPGVERAQFLMQKFGRSGSDMGKLMEVGGEGIDKAMGAVEDSLVVTKKSIEQTDKYKQNLDKLGDAWMGIKVTVGNAVIPVINSLIGTETDLNKITEDSIRTQMHMIEIDKELGSATQEELVQLEKYQSQLNTMAANQAWADNLNAQAEAYFKLHPEARQASVDMDALKVSADGLAASFKPLTNEIIYNTLAASLDTQGQLDLARHLGLMNESAYNATMQLAGLTTEFDTNKNGVVDLTERTDAYYAALKNVTDTAGTYYWNFVTKTNDIVAPAPPSSNYRGSSGKAEPHANGGSWMIPMSFGNEGYIMPGGQSASGGETVTVTPKNQQGGMTAEEYKMAMREQAKIFGNQMALKLAELGVLR